MSAAQVTVSSRAAPQLRLLFTAGSSESYVEVESVFRLWPSHVPMKNSTEGLMSGAVPTSDSLEIVNVFFSFNISTRSHEWSLMVRRGMHCLYCTELHAMCHVRHDF